MSYNVHTMKCTDSSAVLMSFNKWADYVTVMPVKIQIVSINPKSYSLPFPTNFLSHHP